MKRTPLFSLSAAVLGAGALLLAQQHTEIKIVQEGTKPAIAVPDFHGAGEAQPLMDPFNRTLWNELSGSGQLKMIPKAYYPLQVPQQPSDFKTAPQTPSMTQWSAPPINGNWLAFGYTAVQNGQLVLYGWLYNVTQATPQSAQVLGKIYLGSLDEAGAMKVARDFAADILKQFGAKSLAGSKIYYVSDRTGHKEIWSMDYDGSNQKQITHYNDTCITPSVSPDGTKLAFTSFAKGNPSIFVFSLETGRQLLFYNQKVSLNTTPNFTPDGKKMLFASTANGYTNIFEADPDGSHLQRISNTRKIEVEPKVNPKTGTDVIFVSGRSGPQQIWKMSRDGSSAEMLTSGDGDASNPSWHPNGQIIAFSWTRGFEPGNFNIFLMDVASKKFDQLTHGAGRNENPNWAPDGRHLVFASNRSGGKMQIFTMLADGTHVQQLTTEGRNTMPVWGK